MFQLQTLIERFEERSVALMEEVIQEARETASPELSSVSDEELGTCLYMLNLRTINFLKEALAASDAPGPQTGDFREIFLRGALVIVDAIDGLQPYTEGHSEMVARHAGLIAARLGLSDAEVENVEYAALICNLGMINTSQKVLLQPRRLTAEELSNARHHAVIGADMIRPVDFLAPIHPMVRYHHTHFDGSGFPGGVSGEQIALGARIIAVADAYQAMRSERPHRPALPRDDALLEIEKNAGKQFDPKLIPYVYELRDEY